MTDFEFVFSLFGLLLGLGLAEVLGGFGAAIQHRRKVRIGWLTPLMGLFVTLDLTSFWTFAWSIRDLVPAHSLSLLGGLLTIGLYYFVARITFPHDPSEWPDYDTYYFENRKWVLGGIALVNAIAILALEVLGASFFKGVVSQLSLLVFVPALFAAMFVQNKRVNIALLLLLIVQYGLIPVVTLIEVGR